MSDKKLEFLHYTNWQRERMILEEIYATSWISSNYWFGKISWDLATLKKELLTVEPEFTMALEECFKKEPMGEILFN